MLSSRANHDIDTLRLRVFYADKIEDMVGKWSIEIAKKASSAVAASNERKRLEPIWAGYEAKRLQQYESVIQVGQEILSTPEIRQSMEDKVGELEQLVRLAKAQKETLENAQRTIESQLQDVTKAEAATGAVNR